MGSWTKKDIVEAMAPRLGSRAAAVVAVEAFTGIVTRAVAEGDRVTLTGFGSFEPVARRARTGRNPRTGEAVSIPARTTPAFRPGTAFKSVVADPTLLPAEPAVEPVVATPATRPAADATASGKGPKGPSDTDADAKRSKKSGKKKDKKGKKHKKGKKGKKHEAD